MTLHKDPTASSTAWAYWLIAAWMAFNTVSVALGVGTWSGLAPWLRVVVALLCAWAAIDWALDGRFYWRLALKHAAFQRTIREHLELRKEER